MPNTDTAATRSRSETGWRGEGGTSIASSSTPRSTCAREAADAYSLPPREDRFSRRLSAARYRKGARRAFTITSVDRDQARYPRAHTCFHRVDLPLYEHEADLVAAFDDVLSNEAGIVGFSMD